MEWNGNATHIYDIHNTYIYIYWKMHAREQGIVAKLLFSVLAIGWSFDLVFLQLLEFWLDFSG